jgi:predicted RNA-binding protein with TRAM domain
MDVPDNLLCVFSARVEEQRDSYVIEVPKHEITNGAVEPGAVYRTALLATATEADESSSSAARTKTDASTDERRQRTETGPDREASGPPVEEGEVREVEIEGIGDQGDGIARVERGYVIIVPETEEGERVTIEITNVRENVAFSEVVEREDHFE